jgi:hypothetical protein
MDTITTDTCQIDTITDNGDGTAAVTVTWGYSDGTTFSTTYPALPYRPPSDSGAPAALSDADVATLVSALGAQVAGPNAEEQAVAFGGAALPLPGPLPPTPLPPVRAAPAQL